MGDPSKEQGKKRRLDIFGSIFPREYDFEGMLADQAGHIQVGVQTFVNWLQTRPLQNPAKLEELEGEADRMRHDLEEKLITSFSTPFDRQDIYSISRQIDYILNYAGETAREMYAFGVEPDGPIAGMADALLAGTACVAAGVKVMNRNNAELEEQIRLARAAIHRIEDIYIMGMADLLHTNDAMAALRKREVYHHLRDAGRALRNTADIMHRTAVGLA
ncbi:hypothetical protein Metli_2250 [Methanofollis liminatans DSM 4140]|uniref:Phosphate transport regulator n=1 Tax=Methanofollis liminatans DSM 4140 TaxID=28892 RepID=J0SBR5_9EURY|nr:DUF47 family protein [Methanofollis liminatans]EJG08189.1 hypothetical protein Metli_2250 [Methanofollis liminatans DSM 4140]